MTSAEPVSAAATANVGSLIVSLLTERRCLTLTCPSARPHLQRTSPVHPDLGERSWPAAAVVTPEQERVCGPTWVAHAPM